MVWHPRGCGPGFDHGPGGRHQVRPDHEDRCAFDVKAITGDNKGKTLCYI